MIEQNKNKKELKPKQDPNKEKLAEASDKFWKEWTEEEGAIKAYKDNGFGSYVIPDHITREARGRTAKMASPDITQEEFKAEAAAETKARNDERTGKLYQLAIYRIAKETGKFMAAMKDDEALRLEYDLAHPKGDR